MEKKPSEGPANSALEALGATLFYAVEGRAPFDRGHAIATLRPPRVGRIHRSHDRLRRSAPEESWDDLQDEFEIFKASFRPRGTRPTNFPETPKKVPRSAQARPNRCRSSK